MSAIKIGTPVGTQGKSNPTPRPILEFEYKGKTHYLAVTIGNNGFVVGANPSSRPRKE